jgi:RNA polymerase sigma-70 factor (ECF subfamily)
VVARADEAAVLVGAAREVHGAAAVAETFSGRTHAARIALVDGSVGLVWAPGDKRRPGGIELLVLIRVTDSVK